MSARHGGTVSKTGTWEAETGGSQVEGKHGLQKWILGQFGLYSKSLSQFLFYYLKT